MAQQLVSIQNEKKKTFNHDLEEHLRSRVKGEVRFDKGSRALYATDGSNYRQPPIAVVIPKTIEDVIATIAVCREHGAPVFSRGGGTSLAGQCCNTAVVMDFSKYMHNILELDAHKRQALVQPGVILDELRKRAEEHHLTFAPDPSTHNHCTLGGMIGNNSCGVHSVMGGKTEENTIELDVVLYDGTRMQLRAYSEEERVAVIKRGGRQGEIFAQLTALRDGYANLIREKYPKIPRRVSGYNLPSLLPENGFDVAKALVGSESTCVTVLQALVRLVPSPPQRSLLVLGYKDIYTAADHVMEVLEAGPIGLEAIDDNLVHYMKIRGLHADYASMLPSGSGWLLVEFGADSKAESDEKARALMARLKFKLIGTPSMKLYDNKEEEEHIWKVRESGLGATAFVPGMKDTWEGWEDSAVPPQKMGDYLRDFRALLEKFNYHCALYGHFGQGCLHTRIEFDLATAKGIQKYREFVESAADLVIRYGGSLSGEHGDGQSRGELLEKMFGPKLIQAFHEFKEIWDPDWKMNPGKVVEPYRLDENLRLGAGYDPWRPKTHFQFPDDHGDFSHVAMRCVGVGDCRRMEQKTMCPSYRVTREEMHATRGRGHLLFEMTKGGVLEQSWDNEPVKEALDLCLACKGCKGDCPVNVDMATYKAEFLSHYYEHHRRPLHAYGFGYIDQLARLGSLAPGLANFVAEMPVAKDLMKFFAGMPQERSIPKLAKKSFTSWFRERKRILSNKPMVILWPDTFNNYFFPQTAIAAVEVLEDAGFQVYVPQKSLCCGRPLYDFGMLTRAERLLREILEYLKPLIAGGVPLVGLEPSCVAVFKDELKNLLANDDDAKKLAANAYVLPEFLEKHAPEYQPPRLVKRALIHEHCHQKALVKHQPGKKILQRMGMDFEFLDSGCCGMAGSFGFEKNHYEVSMKVGELVLLPAVRNAAPETLIITDGFSCREQIKQGTPREAMHFAELMQMAIREGVRAPGERKVA